MAIGVYERPLRSVVIPVGPSIAYVPLTKGQYSLIDSADADWCGQWNWIAWWNKNSRTYYAVRSHHVLDRIAPKTVRMHRELLRAESGQYPDHRNGDTLDNRRSCNLRIATASQNAANRCRQITSSSGLKGVSFRPESASWRARIQVDGRSINLGGYPTKQDAHNAYAAAAAQHFGEFARIA